MIEINSFISNLLPFFHSPLGIVIFIPLYALWVALLLPGVWVSMLAGFLYGTWLGSLVVFIGAFIGAQTAFWISRNFLRNWVQVKINSSTKLKSVSKAVSKEGLRLVFLTRLSPAFPFSFLNLAREI